MKTDTIPYLDKYEEYLALEKRLAEKTIESYLSDIESFFTFSPVSREVDSLQNKSEPLKAYFKDLQEMGIAPRTVNRNISSLKGFFDYLVGEELLKENPFFGIKPPKIQKYKPDYLDRHEMDAVYQAINQDKRGGKRDLALIELLYGAGLRISEAINLPLDKIDLKERLLLIEGKGNKQRVVPIGNKVKESILLFMNYERPLLKVSTDHLITNLRGGALTRMGAWKIIQKIIALTDIKKNIYPHTFRHTYASHLIEAGADLRAVQELLGHSDITTTEIYTHLNQDYLFEAHQTFHPRNN